MSKIYGYSEMEIKEFINEIKENKGPLSILFERWATKKGKAKGTVRNMYYAIAEKSRTDEEFCKEYFDGKPIRTKKATPFRDKDTALLMRRINDGVNNGKSVRSITLSLANGDAQKALRLQNKFRSECKKSVHPDARFVKKVIGEERLSEISSGIDALINKISGRIAEENRLLRERIRKLSLENFMLKNGEFQGKKSALDFLLGDGDLPC